MWGTKRPHVDDFIDHCFETFDMVIIWSAGTEKYVNKVVENLFYKRKPHHVFHRDHCLMSLTHNGEEIRQKPLSLLSKRVPETMKI